MASHIERRKFCPPTCIDNRWKIRNNAIEPTSQPTELCGSIPLGRLHCSPFAISAVEQEPTDKPCCSAWAAAT
jgi:hypothetical protein